MAVIATSQVKGAVMKYPSHLRNESQANTIRPICVRPDQAAAMLGMPVAPPWSDWHAAAS